MSNFVRSVPFDMEFDGDSVTMNLTPLKRGHMQMMAPFIKSGEDGDKLSFADNMAVLEVAAEILPENVKDFAGLTIEGTNAGLDEVVGESYFIPLIGEILSKLFDISTVKSNEEKNSVAPSGTS